MQLVQPDAVQDLPDDAPVLILLPGLTGGSHDSYVRHMVGAASKNGLRSVVFNSRGTSDGPVTSPQFYSASYTGDMRYVWPGSLQEECALVCPIPGSLHRQCCRVLHAKAFIISNGSS